DACSAVSTNISHLDATNLCLANRTFTVRVSDQCLNTNTTTAIFTWTVDQTPPSLTVTNAGNLGCNPATLPSDSDVAATVISTDACSAVSTNISHLDATNLCLANRTFTVSVSDQCLNTNTTTAVFSWTVDQTAPSLTVTNGGNLGCNPATLPSDSDVAGTVISIGACRA